MGNFVVEFYCDKVRPLPPMQEFDTIDAAIRHVFSLAQEMAKRALPRGVAGTVSVQSLEHVLDSDDEDDRSNITPEEIKALFAKHPSVPLTGTVWLHETNFETLHFTLQGKKECEAYANGPETADFRRILGAIDASGRTMSGIKIKPDAKNKRGRR